MKDNDVDDLFIFLEDEEMATLTQWSHALRLTDNETEAIRLFVLEQSSEWQQFQWKKLHEQINRTIAYSNNATERILNQRSRRETYFKNRVSNV